MKSKRKGKKKNDIKRTRRLKRGGREKDRKAQKRGVAKKKKRVSSQEKGRQTGGKGCQSLGKGKVTRDSKGDTMQRVKQKVMWGRAEGKPGEGGYLSEKKR